MKESNIEDAYYIADADGVPKGPYTMADLRDRLRDGKITQDTMVIRKGGNQWNPAKVVLAGESVIAKVEKIIPQIAQGKTIQEFITQIPVSKFLFMGHALRMATDGRLFCKIASIAVRIAAALWVVGTFIAWIKAWKIVSDLDGFGVLGGVVFQLLFLVGIYMVTHVLWFRSTEMARQPASDFTIIPLISLFIRMVGDLYASIIMIVGACGCAAILLISENDTYLVHALMRSVSELLPGSGSLIASFGAFGGGTLLEGLLLLLVSAISAFFTLILFYFIAECVLVLVDIARNIRALKERGESPGTSLTK